MIKRIEVVCSDCGETRTINKRTNMSDKCMKCSQVKHGMSRTRLYGTLKNMKARCNKPNTIHYDRYGGRGIKVDPVWDKFEDFAAWALGNGYDESLEIDRIDNDGNYSPENCRWVSKMQNAANKPGRQTKTGYPHIFLVNNSTYAASFVHQKKRHTVSGKFKTPREAAVAYNSYCDLHSLDRRRIEVGNT